MVSFAYSRYEEAEKTIASGLIKESKKNISQTIGAIYTQNDFACDSSIRQVQTAIVKRKLIQSGN